MILWKTVNGRLHAKSAYQGGTFASVEKGTGGWQIRWWVGPEGTYSAPSKRKAIAWVERFAERRLSALGRQAATPGVCPYDAVRSGAVVLTAEEKARYEAFSASYDRSREKKRRSRR